jgi:catechol 2,3-dioxygenase-like lactoylglutathione lyase family enzyme
LIERLRPSRLVRGRRLRFTISVDDADAACAELTARGVTLLNGPVDRPWGQRTAAFADPAGHVREIAQAIPAPAGRPRRSFRDDAVPR